MILNTILLPNFIVFSIEFGLTTNSIVNFYHPVHFGPFGYQSLHNRSRLDKNWLLENDIKNSKYRIYEFLIIIQIFITKAIKNQLSSVILYL